MIISTRRAGAGRAAILWLLFAGAGCDSSGRLVTPAGSAALALVAGGLSAPVLVTAPPADSQRLFIVEQTGLIKVVRRDTLLATPFLDLTAHVYADGELGLLGMAFAPDYATSGVFYVHYTDSSWTSTVVRYHVSAQPDLADPASAETLLIQPQPFPNHNGGMLAFGPDGYLYIALGDGGSANDPLNSGQTLTTRLGKILRVAVGAGGPYTIPAGNPFVGRADALPEIWAWGLRNPWRFSFDRLTGDLWIADVGQGQREEIDRQPAASAGGLNYGWRPFEGTLCVAGPCPGGTTPPVFEYSHAEGCSINGGYVYRGTRVPALAGQYLFADYCAGWVRTLDAASPGPLARDWPALSPGGTLSSFGEDARGELYVVRYGPGAVFRIVAAP